jgi:tetratricopeptide (TPR) repeat protein
MSFVILFLLPRMTQQYGFHTITPIEQAENLIAAGRFKDAYKLLNQLIGREFGRPDVMLLLLRAQCQIRLELAKECLADMTSIIDSPFSEATDVRAAFILRSGAHLQLGDFASADDDAKSADDKKTITRVADAVRLSKIAHSQHTNGQIDEAKRTLDHLLRLTPKAPDALRKRADIAWMESDHDRFLQVTKELVEAFPNDTRLNFRRGLVLLCADDLDESKKCLTRSAAQRKAPRNATVALSAIADIEQWRPEIAAKGLFAFNMTTNASLLFCDHKSALVQRVNLLGLPLLRAQDNEDWLLAVITQLIEASDDAIELLLERGDIRMRRGEFDAAMIDYQTILMKNPAHPQAINGYKRAYKERQNAKRVDYYAVLNVSKYASAEAITASYKKLVRDWHPDRFSGKDEKKKAERMMTLLNTAYDVLNNPKKKKIYDAGEDPGELEDFYSRFPPGTFPGGFPEGGFPEGGFPERGFPFEEIFGPGGMGGNPFGF